MRYLIPPALATCGIAWIFLVAEWIKKGLLPKIIFSQYDPLNVIFTAQIFVLPLTGLVLVVLYFYDRQNFKKYFRVGDINAVAVPIKWLGIGPGTHWKKLGSYLALILTSGTLLFMIIGLASQKAFQLTGTYFSLWPLAALFSVTNAWSEEIFTRFTIVMGFSGKIRPDLRYWISAAVFGIPHYFGMPGGIIGTLMAGFLGWLLAKSIYETKGIFWAWMIHFVQDVVIFSAMMMMLLSKNN